MISATSVTGLQLCLKLLETIWNRSWQACSQWRRYEKMRCILLFFHVFPLMLGLSFRKFGVDKLWDAAEHHFESNQRQRFVPRIILYNPSQFPSSNFFRWKAWRFECKVVWGAPSQCWTRYNSRRRLWKCGSVWYIYIHIYIFVDYMILQFQRVVDQQSAKRMPRNRSENCRHFVCWFDDFDVRWETSRPR